MSSLSVLLIDDEIDFITPLSKRLRRRGLNVSLAAGGQQALNSLARESFDVILLDIKMEGMDGIKVLSEIRQRYPKVAVLMLTGHANTDIVISSLAMGACDYLLKPVNVDDLVLRIESAAGRKNQTK